MEPRHPRINPDRDREKNLFLDDDVVVTLSNGDTLIINKGFKFDGHSVPQILWNLFPPYDYDVYAALVHDYLLSAEFGEEKARRGYKRSFCDSEYDILMQVYKASDFRSFWMPLGVKVWGFLTEGIHGK